jgi:two-component system cell cycle sensor histidine kinase/response regulator CckA
MRIAYIDSEERYQFVNRFVEEHEGHPSAELIGKTVREILGEDRYERARVHLADALAGRSFVQTWYGPFGDKLADVRATFVPNMSDSGDVLSTIMLLEDVSEAKALGEQLRQAQKMKAIGQLTGGIAHDFNNLLTVILGNLELPDSQLDDPQLAKRIEIASRAVGRGADLTDKLLTFARRRALRPEHADLNVAWHNTEIYWHVRSVRRSRSNSIWRENPVLPRSTPVNSRPRY